MLVTYCSIWQKLFKGGNHCFCTVSDNENRINWIGEMQAFISHSHGLPLSALDMPETAKTTEADQYTVSNLHKINTDLALSRLLLWMTKMSGFERPSRYRLVHERNRCICAIVDSHLSPQLKQNPHTHANNTQTSREYIRHIPQEAYTLLLPLCLLSSLIWADCPGRNDNGRKRDTVWD